MCDRIETYPIIYITFELDKVKEHFFASQWKKIDEEEYCAQLFEESGDLCRKSLKWALKKAYGDLMPRTLTIKDSHNDRSVNKLVNITFDEIYESIHNYFKEEKVEDVDFDSMHSELCEKVLEILRDYYNGVEFGKAQKIINMTFKYLYCLEGVKEQHFKYCHMPLDSYTLEWIYRESKAQKKVIKKDSFLTWSNLEKGEEKSELTERGKYTYYFMTNRIKELLKNENQVFIKDGELLTPLQAEFYIWPQMQLHMAAEEFYSVLEKSCSMLKDGNENKQTEFKKLRLSVKFEKIKELMSV